MILPTLRRTSLALVAVLTLLSASRAQAGPFEDLLFGRRNAYYYPVGNQYVQAAPVVTQYAPAPVTAYQPVAPATAAGCACRQPVTTNYANVQAVQHVAPAATTGAPVVANTTYFAPAPATTCYAPVTAGCGCGPQRTVNAYPPVPNYRTVWYRVPVTNFRPVTAFDPVACAQVTTLQPCTTYTWEARRVPARGGLFSWLCRRRSTARVAPIYPYSACVTQPVISGGTPTIITTPGTTVQGSQAPADIPPSLDPGTYVPQGGASLDSGTTIPSETHNGTIESARPSIDCPPTTTPGPTTTLDPYSSSQTTGPATGNQRTTNQATNRLENSGAEQASKNLDNTRGRPLNVREPNPVAAPDNVIQTQKRFAPPRLINPRDRSAARGPAPGSFVLVSWPTEAKIQPSRAQQTQPAALQAAPTAKGGKARNDSGWRSVPR